MAKLYPQSLLLIYTHGPHGLPEALALHPLLDSWKMNGTNVAEVLGRAMCGITNNHHCYYFLLNET